jgi:hypothetical protein
MAAAETSRDPVNSSRISGHGLLAPDSIRRLKGKRNDD